MWRTAYYHASRRFLSRGGRIMLCPKQNNHPALIATVVGGGGRFDTRMPSDIIWRGFANDNDDNDNENKSSSVGSVGSGKSKKEELLDDLFDNTIFNDDDDDIGDDDDDIGDDDVDAKSQKKQWMSQKQQKQQQQEGKRQGMAGQYQQQKMTSDVDYDDDDDDGVLNPEEEYTGRTWIDPYHISDEDWSSNRTLEDIPDWKPELVSRIAQERLKILPGGIPTLNELSKLSLPGPPPLNPGHGYTKAYAAHRKKQHYEYVFGRVKRAAQSRIAPILELSSWEEKQDAVDELFESIEMELKEKEVILGKHPHFGKWVERAMESYLRSIAKGGENQEMTTSNDTDESSSKEQQNIVKESKDAGGEEEGGVVSVSSSINGDSDDIAVPLFMDCYDSNNDENPMVPTILSPLKPHQHDGPGRMVEEWELSAHQETKRILLRQCTRQIARYLDQSENAENKEDIPARVFVSGKYGVGKTAVLASIVASARKSGYIVLYLPDGDRLHKHGYYIKPSVHRDGTYDLPILSQEILTEFRDIHKDDLNDPEFVISMEMLQTYFTELQINEKILKDNEGSSSMTLMDLLSIGIENTALAPMCYSTIMHYLMNQTKKPFLIVMDEFNCYYAPGHYYHEHYDFDVVKSIPYDQINLFEPFLKAMALQSSITCKEDIEDVDESELCSSSTPIVKRGGIVVGTTESRAVARKATDSLTNYAKRVAAATSSSDDVNVSPMYVVDVPHFSKLEVDHVLANFEATGIGNLRCDQGETIRKEQEVAYLRMISGGVGQRLLNACCW